MVSIVPVKGVTWPPLTRVSLPLRLIIAVRGASDPRTGLRHGGTMMANPSSQPRQTGRASRRSGSVGLLDSLFAVRASVLQTGMAAWVLCDPLAPIDALVHHGLVNYVPIAAGGVGTRPRRGGGQT